MQGWEDAEFERAGLAADGRTVLNRLLRLARDES